MQDRLEGIHRTLRHLFWILVPAAFTFFVLGLMLIYSFVNFYFGKVESRSAHSPGIQIMVAAHDLQPGTTLCATNLTACSSTEREAPYYALHVQDAWLLLGHRVIRPVPRGELVTWTDTDIPARDCPEIQSFLTRGKRKGDAPVPNQAAQAIGTTNAPQPER
jgi:Flp pilus assembly protein CpaB